MGEITIKTLNILYVLSVFWGLFFPTFSMAQVRIVQWSDAHSTVGTMAKQVAAIDHYGKEFLSKNPNGEFVVYVLGDFTSLNPYSQVDSGQLSFEGLRLLKEKGYTVLFTPGNHDAFDWTGKIDGSELFLQQMKQLQNWGIPVLAANLKKPRKPFSHTLHDSYELKTLDKKTHIVGMTLESFYDKSNLPEMSGRKLFSNIRKYEPTLQNVLPELKNEFGAEQVFVGIHHGFKRLEQLSENLFHAFNPKKTIPVSLLMGADDHLVAAFKNGHTLVSDAGSHGSFNVIDIDKFGLITTPIEHVAITDESGGHVNPEEFIEGIVTINAFEQEDIEKDVTIKDYSQKLDTFIKKANERLQTSLVTTAGIDSHKRHMKTGRTDLGSALSEALALWAKALPVVGNSNEPIVSMVNSSSYRIEGPIPPGPMTEFTFREMYPFLSEATVYRLKGKEIEDLFFTLRKNYAAEDERRYTPQLNFGVREHEGRLQIYVNNSWENLKSKTRYLVALDGWLSEHRYGQGFRIKLWQDTLVENKTIAVDAFQEILVKYMPTAIQQMEQTQQTISNANPIIKAMGAFKSEIEFQSCYQFLDISKYSKPQPGQTLAQ